ncbi:hypothetical protein [Streptomyces acidiscabies]|nr:hypothetical protein [Streptomyces acidiscabies]
MTTDRPVGHWLKHLDRLLERQFEEAFAVLAADVEADLAGR